MSARCASNLAAAARRRAPPSRRRALRALRASRATAKAAAAYDDDDDDAALTYADVAPRPPSSSVGGIGSRLDVSRAFTADIDPALTAATPQGRSLLDYVRLPAEEYNVLDADNVRPTGDGAFTVRAGVQKILFLEVEPVGVLRIVPTTNGCDQILEGAVMNDAKAARRGTPPNAIIASMNASLRDLKMRNRISAVPSPSSSGGGGGGGGGAEAIKCQIDVAGTFTEGPFAAAGGDRLNGLLSWCLGAVMPWFLGQLALYYGDWSAGKPRGRRSVDVGAVAGEIIGGARRGTLPPGVREVETEASML